MTKRKTELDRRKILRAGFAFVALPGGILQSGCTPFDDDAIDRTKGNELKIHYLEIVTPDVDAVCETHALALGVEFGESDQNLGGARTAKLANGGMLGVRAPMRDTEKPVVRPYMLVEDIQATVDAAANAGAEVAVPPLEIPGHGTFAIVQQGGIDSGFWQL